MLVGNKSDLRADHMADNSKTCVKQEEGQRLARVSHSLSQHLSQRILSISLGCTDSIPLHHPMALLGCRRPGATYLDCAPREIPEIVFSVRKNSMLIPQNF